MKVKEIERKFLVHSAAFKGEAISKSKLVQGFLNTHPDRTVRVRIKGEQGFLTVKGRSNKEGTERDEWEKIISLKEAEDLFTFCEPGVIDKIRYEIPVGKHVFEVDEFLGENKGLTIAEIELEFADEPFEKPNWLGKEVTGQVKYYNSQLAQKPYTTW